MSCEICYAVGLAAMLAGALGALISGKKASLARKIGCTGLLAGTVIAAIPTLAGLLSDFPNVFRLPVLILGAAGAVHSLGYLKGHGEERSGLYFFFYNLTVAAMLSVTMIHKQLPFLVMWEIMGLTSFALVAFDSRSATARRAAWVYLLACQAGGMVLMAMMMLTASPLPIFILSLIGFGLKIGFPLLHFWLPEAHPAAPAPVSSLMSGAMIQLGFYGIFRWGVVHLNGSILGTIGLVLTILGIISCLGGILLALPKNNIKSLLAYSSIENMGIIALGFGLGTLGISKDCIPMAFCGYAGAALHMLNHALLKGGLFLIAGSVLKATGSLEMDKMGGLLKRMPVSGSFFLLNSAGLSGLPPFNAFVSEFLIYLSAFFTFSVFGNPLYTTLGVVVPATLALTGGLAAAAFCKTAGAVFLGEPRSQEAADAVEVPLSMTLPVVCLFLAGCCVTAVVPALAMAAAPAAWLPEIHRVLYSLKMVAVFSAVATALFLVLMLIKLFLLPRGKEMRSSCTWDCGFSKPDARMEYTGSAFVQPLVLFWGKLTGARRQIQNPSGDYPAGASFEESSSDPGLKLFWDKIFQFVAFLAGKFHFLQSGYLHLYILIMTAALLLMLIWGLLLPWSGTLFKGGL